MTSRNGMIIVYIRDNCMYHENEDELPIKDAFLKIAISIGYIQLLCREHSVHDFVTTCPKIVA